MCINQNHNFENLGIQYDSHEFLTILQDGLSDDTLFNDRYNATPASSQDSRELYRLGMALPSNSIIDSLFRGFYLSRLNCTICNYTRYNLDPFSNLQLPIAHLEDQIDARGRHITPNLQVHIFHE
jgi:ubiquitin C-terminal hydrolase